VGTAAFFLFGGSFPVYKYLAPPFGETHAAYIMEIFWASVIAVYFAVILSSRSKLEKMLVPLVRTCFLSLIGLLMLDLAIVKSVRVKEPNGDAKYVRVIIGFVRTSWANDNYRGATDQEILEGNGATDKKIEKAWEPWSILLAKLLFGVSFLGVADSLFAIAMIHSRDPQVESRAVANS
jgi:hypothetical protein